MSPMASHAHWVDAIAASSHAFPGRKMGARPSFNWKVVVEVGRAATMGLKPFKSTPGAIRSVNTMSATHRDCAYRRCTGRVMVTDLCPLTRTPGFEDFVSHSVREHTPCGLWTLAQFKPSKRREGGRGKKGRLRGLRRHLTEVIMRSQRILDARVGPRFAC